MPVPHREKPDFSPQGKYFIDVDERKQEGSNHFHDVDNFSEACNLENVKPNSIAHFNNRKWAIQRGYVPCGGCQP